MIPQEVGILEEAKEGMGAKQCYYYIILVAIPPCQFDLTAPSVIAHILIRNDSKARWNTSNAGPVEMISYSIANTVSSWLPTPPEETEDEIESLNH
jgi:hypothetical protein